MKLLSDDFAFAIDRLVKSELINCEKIGGDLLIEYRPSVNFQGYIQTGNQHFIDKIKLTRQNALLDSCAKWFSETHSESLFEIRESVPIQFIIEFRDHKLVQKFNESHYSIDIQLACLYLIGAHINGFKSISINKLIEVVTDAPMEKLLIRKKWNDLNSELADCSEIEITLNEHQKPIGISLKISEIIKFFPLNSATFQNQRLKENFSDHFQVVEPDNINATELLYSNETEQITSGLYRIFKSETFNNYKNKMHMNNLKATVSIMLIGQPGTGKTELAY